MSADDFEDMLFGNLICSNGDLSDVSEDDILFSLDEGESILYDLQSYTRLVPATIDSGLDMRSNINSVEFGCTRADSCINTHAQGRARDR